MGDYSANYTREPAFDPTTLIVVTWKLDNNQTISGQVTIKVSRLFSYSIISCTVMKMVVSFYAERCVSVSNGGNRSLVYYFYNMTEWVIRYASVELNSCGYTWTQPCSNTTAISNISLMQSNVDVPGKWLFMIGDKGKIIHPG